MAPIALLTPADSLAGVVAAALTFHPRCCELPRIWAIDDHFLELTDHQQILAQSALVTT